MVRRGRHRGVSATAPLPKAHRRMRSLDNPHPCTSPRPAPPCRRLGGPEEGPMRAHILISILAASGALAVAGWGLAAPKPGAVSADNAIPVDVELVIAVDVSYS